MLTGGENNVAEDIQDIEGEPEDNEGKSSNIIEEDFDLFLEFSKNKKVTYLP